MKVICNIKNCSDRKSKSVFFFFLWINNQPRLLQSNPSDQKSKLRLSFFTTNKLFFFSAMYSQHFWLLLVFPLALWRDLSGSGTLVAAAQGQWERYIPTPSPPGGHTPNSCNGDVPTNSQEHDAPIITSSTSSTTAVATSTSSATTTTAAKTTTTTATATWAGTTSTYTSISPAAPSAPSPGSGTISSH